MENVHHKVDRKGLRQRAEDLTSPKQTPESGLKREKQAETLKEQKETKTHVCEEAEMHRPVPRRMHQGQRYSSTGVIRDVKEIPKQDPYYITGYSENQTTPFLSSAQPQDSTQVDVTSLRRSFEGVMSVNPSTESGVRRTKRASPGGNVALQNPLWKCKEKREQVCEEQKEAATCVHKDPKIPVLPRRNHSVPISQEHKQVDVKFHSESPQDLRAVRAAMESRGRRQDSVSPEEKVATQTELWGCEVEVTLDPATAHPRLVLSEDRKSARRGDTRQDLPNNPERFDVSSSVLGSEGFTSGRHYWEVEVEVAEEGHWAIGVARDSVRRKGKILLQPSAGIWVITPFEIPPFLPKKPKKIGVYLNYAMRKVTFYDVENMAPLSSLTAEFTGRVVPIFYLSSRRCYLNLSPCKR